MKIKNASVETIQSFVLLSHNLAVLFKSILKYEHFCLYCKLSYNTGRRINFPKRRIMLLRIISRKWSCCMHLKLLTMHVRKEDKQANNPDAGRLQQHTDRWTWKQQISLYGDGGRIPGDFAHVGGVVWERLCEAGQGQAVPVRLQLLDIALIPKLGFGGCPGDIGVDHCLFVTRRPGKLITVNAAGFGFDQAVNSQVSVILDAHWDQVWLGGDKSHSQHPTEKQRFDHGDVATVRAGARCQQKNVASFLFPPTA